MGRGGGAEDVLERLTTGGGAPPPSPPRWTPLPQTKVIIVGKKESYRWENLVGPFLVHKLLGPRSPPSSLLMHPSINDPPRYSPRPMQQHSVLVGRQEIRNALCASGQPLHSRGEACVGGRRGSLGSNGRRQTPSLRLVIFHAPQFPCLCTAAQWPCRSFAQALTKEDFYRILTEPQANLIYQNKELMRTEDVTLDVQDEAVQEIAEVRVVQEGPIAMMMPPQSRGMLQCCMPCSPVAREVSEWPYTHDEAGYPWTPSPGPM